MTGQKKKNLQEKTLLRYNWRAHLICADARRIKRQGTSSQPVPLLIFFWTSSPFLSPRRSPPSVLNLYSRGRGGGCSSTIWGYTDENFGMGGGDGGGGGLEGFLLQRGRGINQPLMSHWCNISANRGGYFWTLSNRTAHQPLTEALSLGKSRFYVSTNDLALINHQANVSCKIRTAREKSQKYTVGSFILTCLIPEEKIQSISTVKQIAAKELAFIPKYIRECKYLELIE